MFRIVTIVAVGLGLGATSCTRGGGFSFDELSSRGRIAGTDVGNPKRPTKAAITILDAICDTLARCLGVSQSACQNGAPTATGLDAALGLTTSYGPFSSVINADGTSLLGSPSAAQNCAQQIETLSCSDPRVAASYNGLVPGNPFGPIASIVPSTASCTGVYASSLTITPPSASVATSANVILNVSGGTPPYVFTALPGGPAGSSFTSSATSADYQAPGSNSGVQVITARDAAGQTVQATITVVNKNIAEIRAGGDTTCGKILGGAIQCTGANDEGQLANGTILGSSTPVAMSVSIGAPNLFALSMASGCATTGGVGNCWGRGTSGQLGDNTVATRLFAGPVQAVPAPMVNVFSGAGNSMCGITALNELYCWGSNTNGQLGNNLVGVDSAVPSQVNGLPNAYSYAGIGEAHACAVNGGALYCWGSRALIGNGLASGNVAMPVPVLTLTSGVTQVSVGFNHTCAIVSGALWCWGMNVNGEVGTGNTTPLYTPTVIIAAGVTSVAAGFGTTCAVVSGQVYCWGRNDFGQVGIDTGGLNVTTPYPMPLALLGAPATQVAVGNQHSCALVKGTVRCWGKGVNGQLGSGSNANSTTPALISSWK